MVTQRRLLAGLLACFVPAALWAYLGWRHRWTADDAFIGYRVARNLLDGYGPIFNLGERVEVFTSPIWIGSVAAFSAVLPRQLRESGGLEWLCVALGLGCSFVGLLAASAASIRLQRSEGRTGPFFPVGALAIALFPPNWDFATSGVDSALVFAWLGVSFWLLVATLPRFGERSRLRLSAVALVLGLGPLVRPDLVPLTACWFLAFVACRPTSRARAAVGYGAVAAALPLAYQIFRMGYYAAWVSNTAIAKEASAAYWSQGWRYAADLFSTYRLEPLVAAALIWLGLSLSQRVRQRDWASVVLRGATLTGALLQAFFVVRVGGDFMHARMLLPELFALVLPLAALSGVGAMASSMVVICWMLVAGGRGLERPLLNGIIADERRVYMRSTEHLHPVTVADFGVASPFDILEEHPNYIDRDRSSSYGAPHTMAEEALDVKTLTRYAASGVPTYSPAPMGEVIQRPLRPWTLATVIAPRYAIGATAYAAGAKVSVVDVVGGVADPITARLRLESRARPGHEKLAEPAWVLARYLVPSAADAALAEAAATAAARQAYGCGDLAELRQAIEAPLTLGRFLRNIELAGRLTRLRIDPDPLVAESELCGRD